MNIHYDAIDQKYKVEGYGEYVFSTYEDAREAALMCAVYSAEQQVMEHRYRRAAERSKKCSLERRRRSLDYFVQ